MSGPRQIGPRGMTAFVPNGASRRETAIILVGTAQEHGLDDTRAVAATQGGFYITDALADLLYDESESDQDASGNRAEKNNSEEESA